MTVTAAFGRGPVKASCIIALLLLSNFSVRAQLHQPRHFGIYLRPAIERLWSEVEHLYGQEIIERKIPAGEKYGEASVSQDGHPTIALAADEVTESAVSHELLHLKWLTKGFPVCGWLFEGKSDMPSALNPLTVWITQNIRDSIQHWEFYPDIELLGIAPDQPTADEFKSFVKSGKFLGIDTTQPVNLTVAYFRLILLPNISASENLKSDVAQAYLRNRWLTSKTKAEQMHAYILRNRPHSPESEIDCFVYCANLAITELGFTVSVVRWQDLQLGSFRERAVILSLNPFRK